jgi:hypothetical protein
VSVLSNHRRLPPLRLISDVVQRILLTISICRG